jgi:hypothetical protein
MLSTWLLCCASDAGFPFSVLIFILDGLSVYSKPKQIDLTDNIYFRVDRPAAYTGMR